MIIYDPYSQELKSQPFDADNRTLTIYSEKVRKELLSRDRPDPHMVCVTHRQKGVKMARYWNLADETHPNKDVRNPGAANLARLLCTSHEWRVATDEEEAKLKASIEAEKAAVDEKALQERQLAAARAVTISMQAALDADAARRMVEQPKVETKKERSK